MSTVNALSECSLYVWQKERGIGVNKRIWGIEMNEARDTYLQTYSAIDSTDHLVKNSNLFYRQRKYWHSPMQHGMAMGIVAAFHMYEDCCEGRVGDEVKINKTERMSYHAFRLQLSEQLLKYNPNKRKYPGDEVMREKVPW